MSDPADRRVRSTESWLSASGLFYTSCRGFDADLSNQKTRRVTVAIVHDAQFLVEQNIVKASDVRGPIRAGRVYGWYFLPSSLECALSESIVDLRQLYTIPRDVLDVLCAAGGRKARIQPLYREHLAKHFADTFSRIGLPEPYGTE